MPAFPYKLHELLEAVDNHEELRAIISWLPDGKSFRIHSQEEFEKRLLQVYFPRQTQVKSFKRQLQYYDFENYGDGLFSHPCFMRGQRTLCGQIRHQLPTKSQKASGTSTRPLKTRGRKKKCHSPSKGSSEGSLPPSSPQSRNGELLLGGAAAATTTTITAPSTAAAAATMGGDDSVASASDHASIASSQQQGGANGPSEPGFRVPSPSNSVRSLLSSSVVATTTTTKMDTPKLIADTIHITNKNNHKNQINCCMEPKTSLASLPINAAVAPFGRTIMMPNITPSAAAVGSAPAAAAAPVAPPYHLVPPQQPQQQATMAQFQQIHAMQLARQKYISCLQQEMALGSMLFHGGGGSGGSSCGGSVTNGTLSSGGAPMTVQRITPRQSLFQPQPIKSMAKSILSMDVPSSSSSTVMRMMMMGNAPANQMG